MYPNYIFLPLSLFSVIKTGTIAQNWLPKLASELGIKSVRFASFSALSNSYITVPSRLADIEGRNITFEDLKKPPPGYPRNSNIFLKSLDKSIEALLRNKQVMLESLTPTSSNKFTYFHYQACQHVIIESVKEYNTYKTPNTRGICHQR